MKPYLFPFTLMLSILLGALFGLLGGDYPEYIKPLGDMFLNLIFTTVVPLIFFCVSASMTKFESQANLRRLLLKLGAVFVGLGIIASLFMLVLVIAFPITAQDILPASAALPAPQLNLLGHLPGLLTAPQFGQLYSTNHMLALIVFSMLVGIAAKQVDKTGIFIGGLQGGEAVFIQLFSMIMKLAPLGFFAYFANVVHDLGPKLMSHYVYITSLYYVGSIVYFFGIFSLYAYLCGGKNQLRLFWKHIIIPATTAVATCSSAATIPSNCEALKKMQVPGVLADTVIPLGTILHKQGSIMGGIIKIAFLYSLFHMDFMTLPAIGCAVGISLLVGTVMGAIPSGGMLGELLILHVYGFPQSALYLIATISLLIDPPATLLNVTGNTIAGVIIGHLTPRIRTTRAD